MRTLNRSRPFGTISGTDKNIPAKARFIQNNLYFNEAGQQVGGGKYVEASFEDKAENLQVENKRLHEQVEDKDAEIARLKDMLEKRTQENQQVLGELNREAIVAKLDELGVAYDGRSKTETLHKLLTDHLDQAEGS